MLFLIIKNEKTDLFNNIFFVNIFFVNNNIFFFAIFFYIKSHKKRIHQQYYNSLHF